MRLIWCFITWISATHVILDIPLSIILINISFKKFYFDIDTLNYLLDFKLNLKFNNILNNKLYVKVDFMSIDEICLTNYVRSFSWNYFII